MAVIPGQAGGGFKVFADVAQGAREAGQENRARYEKDRAFAEQQREFDTATEAQIAQMLQQARQFRLSQEQQRELAQFESDFRENMQARQQGFAAGESEKQREATEVIAARNAANDAYRNQTGRMNTDLVADAQRMVAQRDQNVYNYLLGSPLMTMDRGIVKIQEGDGKTFWVPSSQVPDGANVVEERENPEYTALMKNFVDYLGADQHDPKLQGNSPQAMLRRRTLAQDWVDNFGRYETDVRTRRREIQAEQAVFSGYTRRLASGGGGGGGGGGAGGSAGMPGWMEDIPPGDYQALIQAGLLSPQSPLSTVQVTRQLKDDITGTSENRVYNLPTFQELQRFQRENPDAIETLGGVGRILSDVDTGIQGSLVQSIKDGTPVVDELGDPVYELLYSQQYLEAAQKTARSYVTQARNEGKLLSGQAESLETYIDEVFGWHRATLEYPEMYIDEMTETDPGNLSMIQSFRHGSGTIRPNWHEAYEGARYENESVWGEADAALGRIQGSHMGGFGSIDSAELDTMIEALAGGEININDFMPDPNNRAAIDPSGSVTIRTSRKLP